MLEPVVLVPGAGSNPTQEQYAVNYLTAQGYRVFQLPDQDLIDKDAAALVAFVANVRATTEAEKVNLVGASLGGVSSLYYVNVLGGAPSVRSWTSIDSPLYGGNSNGAQCLLYTLSAHRSGLLCNTSKFMVDLKNAPLSPAVFYKQIVNDDDPSGAGGFKGLLPSPACLKHVSGDHMGLFTRDDIYAMAVDSFNAIC